MLWSQTRRTQEVRGRAAPASARKDAPEAVRRLRDDARAGEGALRAGGDLVQGVHHDRVRQAHPEHVRGAEKLVVPRHTVRPFWKLQTQLRIALRRVAWLHAANFVKVRVAPRTLADAFDARGGSCIDAPPLKFA